MRRPSPTQIRLPLRSGGPVLRATLAVLFLVQVARAFVRSPAARSSASRQPLLPILHGQRESSVQSLQAVAEQDTASTASTRPSSPFVGGPSPDTKPDYESIVGPLGKPADLLFQTVFRHQLAHHAGFDNDLPAADYQGIVEIAGTLNREVSNRTEIQRRAQETLRSLFPSWMPGQYAILFSKPFPAFSARMNAWATKWAGTWLMGECEINDVEVDDHQTTGGSGKDQGLLVKRCRFLEESGCASVCVNSCKIPTQNFFLQDMGLPLTMEPNYTTFECQFSFGKTPDVSTELEAINTPCLARCPTAGALREWHTSGTTTTTPAAAATTSGSNCQLMD